jgi:hypothetical protein
MQIANGLRRLNCDDLPLPQPLAPTTVPILVRPQLHHSKGRHSSGRVWVGESESNQRVFTRSLWTWGGADLFLNEERQIPKQCEIDTSNVVRGAVVDA